MYNYNFLVSLLLQGRLNKRQLLVLTSLYLQYLMLSEKNNEKPAQVSTKDISSQTGLDIYQTGLTIDSLADFSIIGIIITDNTISKNKIVTPLTKEFVKTLKVTGKKSVNQLINIALNRSKYYIKDDSKVYIFNPDVTTWKYARWGKVSKIVNNLKGKLDVEIVTHLIEQHKNKNNSNYNSDKNILNAYHLIKIFMGKFLDAYGQDYSLNASSEGRKLKTLIIQFERNGVDRSEIPEFFDWAFTRGKRQKKIVHIGFLKYFAMDYIKERHSTEKPQFDVDLDGNKHRIE